MNKLLVVIDCQRGFINEHTQEYVDKIIDLTKVYDKIVYTKFINNTNTAFYNLLGYRRCLNEEDCEFVIETNSNIITKSTYSAVNDTFLDYLSKYSIDEVYLCGFDTDGCVLKTALDLFERNIKSYILKDYCMSSGGQEYHDAGIKILERSIGSKFII